jgi:hypothetical protein
MKLQHVQTELGLAPPESLFIQLSPLTDNTCGASFPPKFCEYNTHPGKARIIDYIFDWGDTTVQDSDKSWISMICAPGGSIEM